MSNDREITQKFWKALKSDRTMFLGLAEGADGHARPMTAQLDDEDQSGDLYDGPIWFFTSADSHLYQQIGAGARAMAHFVAKDHDVWATLDGTMTTTQDRAMIDRLWNRFVAAWYPGGKEDPSVALIRLDPDNAEIWIDASSMVTGLKMLLGMDPKEDMQDKVAKVSL
ncbi:pyridoxamine 5'-phosphate oxidase family protein [Sandarakinorhabdus sp.]|uniref:pyridoxamine 5'-phosphate oxidase family protein n=1 Tax=Sandarakinorhabdus sp. TaxID=1916663 RepID=UPI003F71AFEF